jgi:ferredoxin
MLRSHREGASAAMAMLIGKTCIRCNACITECPNGGIRETPTIYVIDAELCTECVGAFDRPQCEEICPIEGCIVPDPRTTESRAQMAARQARLSGIRGAA